VRCWRGVVPNAVRNRDDFPRQGDRWLRSVPVLDQDTSANRRGIGRVVPGLARILPFNHQSRQRRDRAQSGRGLGEARCCLVPPLAQLGGEMFGLSGSDGTAWP
jgi:hypothetical protein